MHRRARKRVGRRSTTWLVPPTRKRSSGQPGTLVPVSGRPKKELWPRAVDWLVQRTDSDAAVPSRPLDPIVHVSGVKRGTKRSSKCTPAMVLGLCAGKAYCGVGVAVGSGVGVDSGVAVGSGVAVASGVGVAVGSGVGVAVGSGVGVAVGSSVGVAVGSGVGVAVGSGVGVAVGSGVGVAVGSGVGVAVASGVGEGVGVGIVPDLISFA